MGKATAAERLDAIEARLTRLEKEVLGSLSERMARAASRPAAAHVSSMPLPRDLRKFAELVQATAADAPRAARFGKKVFISHVLQGLRDAGYRFDDTARDRLVDAHRSGLLTLSRADLVEAMDPRMVEESETHYLNATFHFIKLSGG